MPRIDSWHRQISTGRHFQNGRHNTAQIQHCPISTTFHMWVEYDVPKWFLTSKHFYRFSMSGHHYLPTIKILSYRTMLNLCGIVAAILKMATGRNFSISGINSTHISNFDDIGQCWIVYRSPFSKWPPQYRTNSTLTDFNVILYVGRLWCPELIPGIDKFLPVAIFKMAATIPHKFQL
jgi:hypothetical protein